MQLLPDAIGSVFAQGETDWELVVVDDGSTDGTEQWLATLSDDRVRVFHVAEGETGTGVAGTRNFGVRQARGEWVLFLDDDDRLHGQVLRQMQVAVRENPDVRWLWGARWMTDGEGVLKRRENAESLRVGPSSGEQAHLAAAKLVTSGLAVHRQTFVALDGFDEALCVSEDRDLIYRLISHDHPGVRLAAPTVWFREHDGPRASDGSDYASKNASDARVVEKNRAYLAAHPQVFVMHLHRVATRQRKAGDFESAHATMREILRIQPSNWKARRRWMTWRRHNPSMP